MLNKLEKDTPAEHSLQYSIERALGGINWLNELEEKRSNKVENCPTIPLRMRIITDAIAMYITTLTEKNGSGHSLPKLYKSYLLEESCHSHDFVKKFISLPVVKKCEMNRHNRSAHESKSYGFFISPREIIESDLKIWLKEMQLFLDMHQEK